MANPALAQIQGDALAGSDINSSAARQPRLRAWRVPPKDQRRDDSAYLRRMGPLTSRGDHASIGTAFTSGMGWELTLLPRDQQQKAFVLPIVDVSNFGRRFYGRNMRADGTSLSASSYAPYPVPSFTRPLLRPRTQRPPRTAESDLNANPPNRDLLEAKRHL